MKRELLSLQMQLKEGQVCRDVEFDEIMSKVKRELAGKKRELTGKANGIIGDGLKKSKPFDLIETELGESRQVESRMGSRERTISVGGGSQLDLMA